MERILLAINAIDPGKDSLEFACYLARLTRSKMVGVFLENPVETEKPVLKKIHALSHVDRVTDEESLAYKARKESIEKNIHWFNEKCINEEIIYSLYRDSVVPVKDLVAESRYADLVVVDAETSFNKTYEGSPTKFVRDFLTHAECPVVIAPKSFESIDEIIFASDGSASSMFALKQFAYLFPQLHSKKVSFVQVAGKVQWPDREKSRVSEWLKFHYNDFHFTDLRGETDTALLDHLLNRKNSFLIMGSYGRNLISQFFKHSHADLLIKIIKQPIFIAHL